MRRGGGDISPLEALSVEDAEGRMGEFGLPLSRVSQVAMGEFPIGFLIESYHYQSTRAISERALMVGFLMIWLKRCILPAENINADVVLPTVILCFDHNTALLPVL